MKSKMFWGSCGGFLFISASRLACADAADEYTSLASWNTAITNESDYTFSGASGLDSAFPSLTFGPGLFTTPNNATVIYNDGLYGGGVQYVAASPNAFGFTGPPVVDVSFSPSADVTALAFTLGSDAVGSDISISVNGLALSPITVSTASPTAFFGVTDSFGPITNITFTDSNFQTSVNGSYGEMDLIGGYATATAVVKAPEISGGSTATALTLLMSGLALISGSERKRVLT